MTQKMPKFVWRAGHSSVKRLCRSLGLDVMRLKNVPRETLAGLHRRPIRTVIDCGANEGQFARYISRFFPDAALYCFEPLEEAFHFLSAWAVTQNNRIRCFNMALGDWEGMAIMHRHVDHSPSSSLLPTTEHEVEIFPQTRKQIDVTVSLTTLDTALGDVLDKMAPEILLKLDVQGYEDRVLHGATRLLGRIGACMLEICVDPLYSMQATFKDLILLLDQHGLEYAGNLDQLYGEDGRVIWLDAIFVRRR